MSLRTDIENTTSSIVGLKYSVTGANVVPTRQSVTFGATAKKFFALRGDSEVAEALERGYAQGGYAEAMRLAAEKLAARSKLTYVQPTRIARLYVSAGEKDRALDWLEKAYEERASQLVTINVAPQWDPLRDDPRFQSLLRRMNFPPQ